MRLVRWWPGLLGAAALMGVTAAPAFGNNFGGHYLDASCCYMYGSRADIGSPATDFTLAFATFGVMRVTSESSYSLIQTGYGQTNSFALDNSCSSSTIKNYFEVLLPNIFPGICGWVGNPGYGIANKYSTFKDNSSDTYWDGAVNGVGKAHYDLQFSLPQRLLPQAARSEDLVTKTRAICTDATDATGTSLGSERRFPAPRLGSPFKLRTR